MKTLGVLVLTIWSVSAYLIKVTDVPVSQPVLTPSGWIHLQKIILPLFENVCDASQDPMIVRLAKEFSDNVDVTEFWNSGVITDFQNLKTKGFLTKGEIFSEYNPEHITELKTIYGVLYNAKNFDTFLKVAAWGRQNLNCGLYVDALYLAFEKRKDTEKLTIPPPYELLPNYFIRKDIIIKGSSLLSGQDVTITEGVKDEGNAYTLQANYTDNFYDTDDEAKLTYFREDIGLNSFYFLKMLNNAPWLNKDIDINSNYGENMYYMMKQLLSRYNMERYSNELPELEGINWDALPTTQYDPMLVYSNGVEFIHDTPTSTGVTDDDEITMLQTIQNNLATVVSHMRGSGYNKTQILNHIMEIIVTNDRSYDTLARHVLGKFLSNNGNLSVMKHYMTSLRDPLFWKLNKVIVDLIDNALKVLPPYMKNELYFPGVEVVSIEAKKLMTNFDYYQFDITDALKIGNGDTTFQVKIGQQRLNHKPFSMKVNISSLVVQKGLVKIYLGPKIMPGEFAQKKNQFVMLDSFEINLKRGSNIVTRTSNDMKHYAPDFFSYRTLAKKVEDAQFGIDSLPVNSMIQQTGYPSRLILPKGTASGLPLHLLVFVAPYVKASMVGSSTLNMEFNSAVLSRLYPFDLPFEDNTILNLPNIFMQEISVTHKTASAYGGSGGKQWGGDGGSYGPKSYNSGIPNNYETYGSDTLRQSQSYNTRPSGTKYDYAAKRKSSYDYKANRPQDKQDETANQTPGEITEVTKEEIVTPKIIDITTKDYLPSTKESQDNLYVIGFDDSSMQNDDSNVIKQSVTDSIKKPKFDYKKFREPFKKAYKNYKKLITSTVTPDLINIGQDTAEPVPVFEKTITKYNTYTNTADDLVMEDSTTNDDVRIIDIMKNIKKEEENSKEIDSVFRIVKPLQKFTIYDFIVNSFGEDRWWSNYDDNDDDSSKSEEIQKNV